MVYVGNIGVQALLVRLPPKVCERQSSINIIGTEAIYINS